jgi:hypothetical protein
VAKPFRAPVSTIPLKSLVFAASALLLCGCQTTFDLVGVAIPLSAGESRHYDGSYQGEIRQASTNGPTCPRENGEKVIMVGDGFLWYAYSPDAFFTPPVNYDGTINARAGNAVLTGKIDGDHLRMLIKSPTCQTNISMNYIYIHS